MLRVIAVRTGTKYSQWYEDNLKHMVDSYSCLEYDSFDVIRDDQYEGVFNKLQMFDRFRDGTNIYFDLDVIIQDDCNYFVRNDFTLCYAHWRWRFHTPLNSSIMSWSGDQSHIYNKFATDPDYYMLKYHRGIDQFIYENIEYNTYDDYSMYNSYEFTTEPHPVVLMNQNHHLMQDIDSKYLLEPS